MDKPTDLYVDTSLIYEWCRRLMADEKCEDTYFVAFMINHTEIRYFTSLIAIAELARKLLFEEKRVRDYKKNINTIWFVVSAFQESTGLRIIEHEKTGDAPLSFTDPDIIELVARLEDVNDSLHVCIAKHESLTLVTHEDKFGRIKEFYPNIMTDRHLFKLF